MNNGTCRQRWKEHMTRRVSSLRQLWEAFNRDEGGVEDLGTLPEYGLSFDYVPPLTWEDQLEGYWRYQLSSGGPADEFRFYASHPGSPPYRVEYWFLDWFDGHGEALVCHDLELLRELWGWFQRIGDTEHAYRNALEDVEP